MNDDPFHAPKSDKNYILPLKLLVIDDESSIRNVLKTALPSYNIEVIEAATGSDGLSVASTRHPDLILLDLSLPDMGGAEVLISLRKWFKKPIIMFSVRSREETIADFLDKGADDYVTKPFDTRDFVDRIKLICHVYNHQKTGPIIRVDDVCVNVLERHVEKDGKEVQLSPIEYKILGGK